jgi:hypothetical protein
VLITFQAKSRGKELWALGEAPKNLSTWDMGRAEEKIDFTNSLIRSQINKDNQYGVFMKVEVYEDWYRKFYNNFLKKGGDKCVACEFPFIYLFGLFSSF